MLQKLRLFWVIALSVPLEWHSFWGGVSAKSGHGQVLLSRNAKYTISIRLLGYPDSSTSECTFTAAGKELSTKFIPTTPQQGDLRKW